MGEVFVSLIHTEKPIWLSGLQNGEFRVLWERDTLEEFNWRMIYWGNVFEFFLVRVTIVAQLRL